MQRIMKPKKIKVWETSDGSIFKNENIAIDHEFDLQKNKTKLISFEVLEASLKKKGISIYKIHSFSWDCDKSPIGECVYESDCIEKYGDECCYYCGEPEERK